MKGKSLLLVTLSLLLVLGLGGGVGGLWAKGPEAPGQIIPPQPLGTAFTYQGQLKQGGNPVNDTCDFQFSLWDAVSGGTQVGTTQTKTVSVSNGLFTVADPDFGAGAFQGDARWLGIAVKCSGEGGYTTLDPRQPLTATPYALYSLKAQDLSCTGCVNSTEIENGTILFEDIGDNGCVGNQIMKWSESETAWVCADDETGAAGDFWSLTGNAGTTPPTNFLGTTDNVALELRVNNGRALRLEPSVTSPNLIGGNSVNSSVVGATIGGGGTSGYTNRVTDDYGTVGGGYGNRAGDDDGTTNNRSYATVGGGWSNTANDRDATVGGGYLNTASGQGATIGGGQFNTASGWGDTTASVSYATVGGGNSNTASGYHATVGGGDSNTTSGYEATVGGGTDNTASGEVATVPGGGYASATHYGEMAYAAGPFASSGDAQTSIYVLRNTTTDATQTELFLDGSGERITIADGRTMTFDILVVGRENDNGESAGYHIWGVIENVGGITAIVGSVNEAVLGEDDMSWSVTVDADDTYEALRIRVQGGTGGSIRWVATVRTAEVAWPS